MQLSFIPQPQKLRLGQGWFTPPARGVIGISDQALYATARGAAELFPRYAIAISRAGLAETIRLRLVPGLKPEEYRLVIAKRGVQIEGVSTRAVFYGLQTLRQIVAQAVAGRLPTLTIDDWPHIPDRGIYYDVCRGRIPKLERLMEMAAMLAKYKINQLQLYIEHTFAFRGHPDIGKGASPLTAEDILKLDAYCRERYIELVPSLSSFGHLSTVLKHPQYHHLAEDWGKGKYVTADAAMRRYLEKWGGVGFTLAPANPKIYRFLDSLFAEFLPLFSSQRFNACCDETLDLGYGQSYKLCQKIGRGRLYLNHIIKLNELSRKYGKRLMMWGDIIRHYPELIPEIPKDITVLDWGYEHNHNFEAIRDFQKAGLRFYGCPSVAGYSALFPRLPKAMANIAGFAAAGYKYGAQGLLNTDWGDGGHANFMEYSWHGFLFGAEQAWNTRADQTTFTARFCRRFLETDDPRMTQALTDLGDINYPNNLWHNIYFANAEKPVFPLGTRGALVSVKGKLSGRLITFDANFGRQILQRLDRIRAVFMAHSNRRGEDPLGVLSYWIFAVDTLKHAANKIIFLGAKDSNTVAARRRLIRAMASLRTRFQKLWRARNRTAEIRITLNHYRKAIQAIRANRLVARPLPGCSSRILTSRAMPGAGKLRALTYPLNRNSLNFKVREFGSDGIDGQVFYDLHNDIFNCAPRDALVYFAVPFRCPRTTKLEIGLGYDGPVKVWVDGKQVYHDPAGTNPANPDKAIIPFDAVTGKHEALIALGSNHGKAWGLFFRLRPRAHKSAGGKRKP